MSETKHATYGPSSLKLRRICAGWRNDQDSDKTAANEGTMMHLAAETGVRGPLNDEQWQQVTKCLKFIAPFEKGAVVHKEQRLEILGGLTFGTSDRVIIKDRRGIVADWKFGYGFIDDAEVNLQGWAYALGVFDNYPVDEVEVIFIVPRRDEVSRHVFNRERDYARIAKEIRLIIERCKAFDASINAATGECDESLLNPHDDACCYCGFIARCPKHRQYALDVAQKYAPLELVDETHSSQISDPGKMAQAFALARIAEKWAASVKKHATEMAKNGIEIPGFGLRERAGNTEISNPVLAYQVLLDAGFEPIEIVSTSKLSKGALEKIVSEKAPHGQKAKSVSALTAALANAECLTSGESIFYLQKNRE